MKRTHFRLIGASVGFTAFFLVSAPALLAAAAPPMGSASTFSVLAALSMSAAGAGTTVSGDLGLSPGLASSRTGPWTVGGSSYFGPSSLAFNAQASALAAFNNLAGQGSNGGWGVNPWSPVPGVWTVASDTTFTGTITLTGTSTDVWVFQVGRDMTFSGSVVLAGTAQACNVFWQVGRSATIASGSRFVGTLIASADVTLVSGATVDGRIISLNSSLTTDGNTVSGPSCLAAPPPCPVVTLSPVAGALPPGTVGTAYSQSISASDGNETGFTFLRASGAFPPGLTINASTGVISGMPTTPGNFTFTITATDNSNGCASAGVAYSIAIAAAPAGATGGPTLDFVGLAILIGLLAAAGVLLVNRFTM